MYTRYICSIEHHIMIGFIHEVSWISGTPSDNMWLYKQYGRHINKFTLRQLITCLRKTGANVPGFSLLLISAFLKKTLAKSLHIFLIFF